jgi:hypothetical protein
MSHVDARSLFEVDDGRIGDELMKRGGRMEGGGEARGPRVAVDRVRTDTLCCPGELLGVSWGMVKSKPALSPLPSSTINVLISRPSPRRSSFLAS